MTFKPINGYHKSTAQVLDQVNAQTTPYIVVKRDDGRCAVFLNDVKVSAWANRGAAIDKAFEMKQGEIDNGT